MKSISGAALCSILIFAFFGCFLLLIGSEGIKTRLTENSWIPTESTVISTRIESLDGRGRMGQQWCSAWTSEYFVGSQRFNAFKQKFGTQPCFKKREDAEMEIKKRPIGSKLQVFYEPSNPGYAVIKTSEEEREFSVFLNASGLGLITGLAFICLALHGIVINFPKSQARNSL